MLSRMRGRSLDPRRGAALVALGLSLVSTQANLPPLPVVAPEPLPPAARASISSAYNAAVTRSNDAPSVGALGRVLHAWEQWDAAHQAYSRAAALAPTQFEWLYLDAIVSQRLARNDEAIERLERALVITPGYLPARVRLAEALLDNGDVARSRPLFEKLRAEPTAQPAAAVGLGRIAALEGRHEDAIRYFTKAIELFPELGAAYYGQALSYRALGRTEDAQRALAKHGAFGARWPAIEDPVRASVTAVRADAAATLQRGITLAQAGDVPGAIAAHERALAEDASLVQARVNLVSLYGRAGAFEKAEEQYRLAVAAGGDLGDAHYDYAVIQGMQQKWDAADKAYRKALEINPAHAQARNNLGQLLERRRDFEAAANEYRQAVESQPTLRIARFNLARMWLALGKNDQAIIELERLGQPVDSETPRYLFALSAAHLRAGHKDEAIAWATEAKRLALEYGQKDLAALIDRDLAKVK
jgi:tetratricopeptide (TPR) repeat protein